MPVQPRPKTEVIADYIDGVRKQLSGEIGSDDASHSAVIIEALTALRGDTWPEAVRRFGIHDAKRPAAGTRLGDSWERFVITRLALEQYLGGAKPDGLDVEADPLLKELQTTASQTALEAVAEIDHNPRAEL